MKLKFNGRQRFVLLSLIMLCSLVIIINSILPTNTPSKNSLLKTETPLNQLGEYNLWMQDGIAISTEIRDQNVPSMISDGFGGAIIVWVDWRSTGTNVSTGADVYAQRINSLGQPLWNINGTKICNEASDQLNPKLVSDGAGGAIIVWEDYRSGTSWDLYAQRINSTGLIDWINSGVPICTMAWNQLAPSISSDGAGGAVIAWQDLRSTSTTDIYAQRILSTGTVLWGANGTAVSTASDNQNSPTIATVLPGEYIITWEDRRNTVNFDIFAQRMNSTGQAKWTANGVGISNAGNNQRFPRIISDGVGGAIITWEDYRSSNYDIYAQRVNYTGQVQWITDGTPICTATQTQVNQKMVSDGAGGAIIAWQDFRTGGYNDVYAQKINFTGQVQWTLNGVAVSTATRDQENVAITSDGAGGAIIAWQDGRNLVDTDVYAQKINSSGSSQWDTDGINVCNLPYNQENVVITNDLVGGAFVAWEDNRSNSYLDIYAQRIGQKGILEINTNASIYVPGQTMKVQANFHFTNGTPLTGATIGFTLRGVFGEPLQFRGNFTDMNGIATTNFILQDEYVTGNYTIYVSALKGDYSSSKSIVAYINATYLKISMDKLYLIGDVITVHALFKFYNGTPINTAGCGFIIRNESGVIQSKGASTNSSGEAQVTFFTTDYAEGYYNMYVTAVKGNYTNTVNQTFFLTLYNGPIIFHPILTPDPPAYNQSGLVNVSIGVPPAYATITGVILSYYNGTGWYNTTMTNSSTPDSHGFAYYSASIPPQNWNLQISYKLWAIDSLGNQTWNDNGGLLFNYTVIDPWGALIEDPIWTTPVAYNTTVAVTVHITEDPLFPTNASGIDTVALYYEVSFVPYLIPMTKVNGTLFDAYYTANIPTYPYGTTVDFEIRVQDFATNPSINDNGGLSFTYTCDDFWGPTISSVTIQNAPIAYNMTANVTCRVQEDTVPVNAAGVQSVILSYFNGTAWNNVTMSRYIGTIYDGFYSAEIPEIAFNTLVQYWIYTIDNAGNPSVNDNSGAYYSYTVDDFWEPLISDIVRNTDPVTYLSIVNITCHIQDPTGPADSSGTQSIFLSYNNGTGWNNATMTLNSGDKYDGIYVGYIPQIDYGVNVLYYVISYDAAGNIGVNDNLSAYYTYFVNDFVSPSISAITLQNPPVAYNMTANVTCRIQEATIPANAAGVDIVILHYNRGAGWATTPMNLYSGTEYDGYYSGLIPETDYGVVVRYWISCNDTANNPAFDDNLGLYYLYSVDDLWGPTISEITLQNPPISYNTTANITCRVQEPVSPADGSGVSSVELYYSDGGPWNSQTMTVLIGDSFDAIYNATIPAFPYGTLIQYYFVATDLEGNPSTDNNNSNFYSYFINDFWAPSISNVIVNNPPITYLTLVNISCIVQEPTIPADASGVDTVILIYYDGIGTYNLTMAGPDGDAYSGRYSILIPRHNYGTNIEYLIWCNDTAGNPSINNNGGNNYSYIVGDLLGPSISEITLQNSPITYNKTANITCRVQEPTTPTIAAGVDTVLLYYHYLGWNSIEMNLLAGDAYDGYYTALIPEIAYGETVQYWIWTNDSADNPSFDDAGGSYYTYFVNDFWSPTISNINIANAPITYDETAIVECQIQEPTVPANASGVITVILSYRFGAGWNNLTMNRFNGDAYNGQYRAFIPFLPYGTTVQFWIWCNDKANNPSWDNNFTNYYSYIVRDTLGPNIATPSQNDTIIEYTEAVNVTVQVTEPTAPATASGVQNVILSYWQGSSWTNLTMPRISGTLYNGQYRETLPKLPYGTEVAYKIYAQDNAGNWALNDNSSAYFNYTVTDITIPTINLISPNNGTTISGIAQFLIQDIGARDTDVVNITVLYQYNATPWVIHGFYLEGVNMSWTPGSVTSIDVNISAWIPGIGYSVAVIAQDLRNLACSPDINNLITVANYTGPLIYNIQHNPDPVGYNETVSITCTVFVPPSFGMIDTVLLNYFDGTWNQILMSNTTPVLLGIPVNYLGTIPQQTLDTQVSYWIFANDTNSNFTNADNSGAYYNYTIMDKWGPTISGVNVINAPITYGEIPDFRCSAREDSGASGVDSVILFWDNGTGWQSVPFNRYNGDAFNGDYAAQITASRYGTIIQYWVWANDTAGNPSIDDNESAYYSYTVADFINPTLSQIQVINAPIAFNMTANVSCQVVEPTMAAGVDTVLLNYNYNNGSGWLVKPMSLYWGNNYVGYYSALIPKAAFGLKVDFWIQASDSAGNSASDNNGGLYYSYNIIDFLPPTNVTGLTAEVYIGARSINLTWTPNSEIDLSHYKIHRALTDVGFIPSTLNFLANTTNAFYLDSGLTDGITYYYIVLAVDQSELISGNSPIVNGTPTSTINAGEVIEVYGGLTTHLEIPSIDVILDFTSNRDFQISITSTTSALDFSGHAPLMSFFIDITTIGAPGAVSGTITLTLNATILATLGEDVDSSTFKIYYWTGSGWDELPSVFHATNQSITATLTHFSIFGAFGTLIKPTNYMIYIIVAIGAVAAVAIVVVLAKRKKAIPTESMLKVIQNRGYVKIIDIAKEFKISEGEVIDIIITAISANQIRGFLANKKKEFYTIDRLKAELTKILEGN